jgi:multidrug efflux pump subunit AcrB
MAAMKGIVMLMGLVSKNAILLIDFAKAGTGARGRTRRSPD